ncbi:VirB4 family type IV secretion system protein [Paenibacillus mesotrionivorans]|uniref:VirB4 family type IV secretion system protein n=1 Tax=Paenibacillus mesotrionivorans TaxID=3160968 RepID=A0ACC7NWB0_9BACL
MLAEAKRLVKAWKREKDHIRVNAVAEGKSVKDGHYVRVVAIKDYPPIILTGYLDALDDVVREAGATLRKTIRYAPADVEWNMASKNKLKRLEKNISAETTYDLARKAEKDAYDTLLVLRDSQFQSNKPKLVDVWTFLTLTAAKKHQLDAAYQALLNWFENVGGVLDDLRREQVEALRQTSMVADLDTERSKFFLKRHYGRATMDTLAAKTYPFTRGGFSEDEGQYVGRRSEDDSFCFVNLCVPDDPRAQNITVFGKTGQGKSFFMKALVGSLLEEGIRVFVFDLDGEWRDLCDDVGGVYIDHTADNGRYFEPMNIMPELPELDMDCIQYNRGRYAQAVQTTIRTISLLADGIAKGELTELGHAIKSVYEQAGIRRDMSSTWDHPKGPAPTIHRLFQEIKSRAGTEGRSGRHALNLLEKIEMYFDGGVYDGLFQVPEPLAFHAAPMVVYKVGTGSTDPNEKDERAKQAQLKMSMAFDQVNANVQFNKFEGKTFSAVLVDEGQRQLKNPELRSAVFGWYTAIRKWNGLMILGSNTPDIMLDTAEGRGMWENTSIRVYFYMEQSAIRSLATHSDIPLEIQQQISQNVDSKRYILEYHGQYDELYMDVPPEEAALYKTRGLKAG